jgi:hypothetical protein
MFVMIENEGWRPGAASPQKLFNTQNNYIMKSFLSLLFFTFLSLGLSAQAEISVIGTGFRAPIGIEVDADKNIWIAESGTGQADGAISVIWADGTIERVIDSLPSIFDAEANETQGSLKIQLLNDQYLAVFISEVGGELGSSILIYDRSGFQQGNASLRTSDALNAIHVGEQVIGRLGFAESNPYSLVDNGCEMLIVDAAANSIIRRDGLTGVMNVFATLSSKPNPLPFGPPFYEPVPTRILKDPNGGFLLSQLTGFPFLDGASNIYQVSSEGEVSVRDSNLTLVTDMRHHPSGDGILALQFAQFRGDSLPPFLFNSSMITHLKNDGSRDTIASGFGPSPGMAVNADGTIYVTHLFLGMVMQIQPMTTGIRERPRIAEEPLRIFPNPAGQATNISFFLEKPNALQLEVFDVSGRRMYQQNLGYLMAGEQKINLDMTAFEAQENGVYFVRLTGQGLQWIGRVVR